MSTNFGQFNSSTPVGTDYLVGYRPGSPSVEQRFLASTVLGQFVPATLAQLIAGADNAAGVTSLGLNQAGLTFATNFVGITKGFLLPKNTDASTGIIKQNGLIYWNTFCVNPNTGGGGVCGNLFIGEGLGNFTSTADAKANLGIGGAGENGEAAGFTSLTSGDENIGIGYGCLSSITTGSQNMILGNAACALLTTGQFNTGVGVNVLGGIIDGQSNVAIGDAALAGTVGNATNNIGIGSGTAEFLTGNENTIVGTGAFVNDNTNPTATTGNTVVGSLAGTELGANVSGCVYIGYNSGRYGAASNEFYVDNKDRGNLTNQKLLSLLYGTFATAATGQGLTVNGKLTWRPWASVTPANNGELSVEATSNSLLTFKLKGTDGTVRSGTLALV